MIFTYKTVWTSSSGYLKNKQMSCARPFTAKELLPAGKLKGNPFTVLNLSLTQLLFSDTCRKLKK